MEKLRIKDIAEAVGAAWRGGDAEIGHVSTDSRDIRPGCLFVALEGERFDGHGFVPAALAKGARAAVVSRPVEADPARLLTVDNTRRALLGIARLYRRSLDVKVVGVTGSVGKTTTKEMIACVCSAGFETLKTEMNLNNEVGLPQTILRLEGRHRAAVLEMGMDGPGQIAPLSAAAEPDIAVVTNIGVSHLEAMGTRENIRDEKLSIRAGMPDGGTLILNGDDPFLRDTADGRLNVMLYGIDNRDCAVTGSRIKEFSTHTTFEILHDGVKYDAQIPSMGKHNVYNALAAFCVGTVMGIRPNIAAAALKKYKPAGMRQRIVVHNSFTVVEDCYNASPDSMRAAMETLGRIACGGKRVAVLSDMLELGPAAEEAHLEAGKNAAESGADALLCTGPLSPLYVEGATAAGLARARCCASKEELFGAIREIVRPGDVLWFKASRGMRLEEVIERVYREL